MNRKVKVLVGIVLTLFFSMVFVSNNETYAEGVGKQWWWQKDKDNSRQQEEIPEPEGGPEETERVKNPVSNIILQQRYPETVVLSGSREGNKIALTFDDGPDPRFTPQILDALREHGVSATFFVMGARAEAYPDLVRRMVDEGHVVANHTFWHPNLVEQGDIATLEREVSQTEDLLVDLVGYETKLFRAPYGFLYNELVEKLAEMDYSVVGWSVDSLDWRELPPEDTAYNVLSNTQPGSIILMHDGASWDGDRTSTIESLDQIISTLREQGLEFVTVPELLNIPHQK